MLEPERVDTSFHLARGTARCASSRRMGRLPSGMDSVVTLLPERGVRAPLAFRQ
jgi:hypothetical protein